MRNYILLAIGGFLIHSITAVPQGYTFNDLNGANNLGMAMGQLAGGSLSSMSSGGGSSGFSSQSLGGSSFGSKTITTHKTIILPTETKIITTQWISPIKWVFVEALQFILNLSNSKSYLSKGNGIYVANDGETIRYDNSWVILSSGLREKCSKMSPNSIYFMDGRWTLANMESKPSILFLANNYLVDLESQTSYPMIGPNTFLINGQQVTLSNGFVVINGRRVPYIQLPSYITIVKNQVGRQVFGTIMNNGRTVILYVNPLTRQFILGTDQGDFFLGDIRPNTVMNVGGYEVKYLNSVWYIDDIVARETPLTTVEWQSIYELRNAYDLSIQEINNQQNINVNNNQNSGSTTITTSTSTSSSSSSSSQTSSSSTSSSSSNSNNNENVDQTTNQQVDNNQNINNQFTNVDQQTTNTNQQQEINTSNQQTTNTNEVNNNQVNNDQQTNQQNVNNNQINTNEVTTNNNQVNTNTNQVITNNQENIDHQQVINNQVNNQQNQVITNTNQENIDHQQLINNQVNNQQNVDQNQVNTNEVLNTNQVNTNQVNNNQVNNNQVNTNQVNTNQVNTNQETIDQQHLINNNQVTNVDQQNQNTNNQITNVDQQNQGHEIIKRETDTIDSETLLKLIQLFKQWIQTWVQRITETTSEQQIAPAPQPTPAPFPQVPYFPWSFLVVPQMPYPFPQPQPIQPQPQQPQLTFITNFKNWLQNGSLDKKFIHEILEFAFNFIQMLFNACPWIIQLYCPQIQTLISSLQAYQCAAPVMVPF